MKKDIHPNYQLVVFWDITSDYKFLSKSTMTSNETIEWEDGNTYPVIKVDVSAKSHPFFTGKKLVLDTTGRVEKFNRRVAKSKEMRNQN
ncbi:large subunit ribosomal protein L31 [Thermonema lapsum]|jgi:large subunit ribosomal protein L31|uniref:Large ribosomal subunit protein bL31B n=1 Tax=Thermonema lapsum TaxID=28195 RepID=A0A846MS18_9BACT|nr:type B 50S ribosomal protein L31 [Thermonema lapsum]NIK74458.1 large subunit ribosomal protein L31 [Thermonema lapsum]